MVFDFSSCSVSMWQVPPSTPFQVGMSPFSNRCSPARKWLTRLAAIARSYTLRWNHRLRLAADPGMSRGQASVAPASTWYEGSVNVVACSARRLLTMVPPLLQPTAATNEPGWTKCLRAWLTASRTSSVDPRYAEKKRGEVTGLSPQPRMLMMPTWKPRSSPAAAMLRTYGSWLPPPSPEVSRRNGLSQFARCHSSDGAPT
mmetsp:Transcript_75249/g.133029  ORF Transcript_75249/g.133029 Transcript_75249/m.133029 type:complete len:201 (-) Transcript_75249:854-1456(-)